MITPTQRTLKYVRDHGAIADVCEQFVRYPPPGHRKDLFGFLDIVAIDGHIRGLQVTSWAMVATRCNKIKNECAKAAHLWLDAGGTIEVWGWKKHDKPIQRKKWRPKVVVITRSLLKADYVKWSEYSKELITND